MTREAMISRALMLFAAVALGVLSAPLSCGAQRPPKVPRVGYLPPSSQPAREEAFRQELRRLGYADGQNVAIEYRSAHGSFERLPDLAAELVGLEVDVMAGQRTSRASG